MEKRKIKISAVINDITLGGAQAILLNIVSLIDPTEFEFEVCYLKDFGPDAPNFQAEFEAAKTRTINLGKGNTSRSTTLQLFVSFLRLYRHFRQTRPDIVQCYLPDSIIAGVLAARLAGVKKIVIHEMNSHQFYAKKLEFLLKTVRHMADLTIFFSETLEAEAFGDYKLLQSPITAIDRKSYTIFNGIDLERVAKVQREVSFEAKRKEIGVSQDAVLVFSAARLIPWKGFEYLIRSFPKVVAACPSAVLAIAGDGEQRPFLEQLVKDLNMSAHIIFLGPRTDVYELLTISDIYPQVYIFPPGVVTISISMSGMEAMAFGVPNVVANYPAMFEGIENKKNAMIVEPRDIDGLADAIIYLASDEAARKEIGRQARLFVEESFSSRKIIHIYESIYLALMTGTNHE